MGTDGTRARSPKCEPQVALSRARWPRAAAGPALAPRRAWREGKKACIIYCLGWAQPGRTKPLQLGRAYSSFSQLWNGNPFLRGLEETSFHAFSPNLRCTQALPNQEPRGDVVRSVPWDSASLRQEPAVSFFSIWQHQIQVLIQGSKQAWGVSVGSL